MDRVKLESDHRLQQNKPRLSDRYAERMAMRLQHMGQHAYRNGFKLTIQENKILYPLTIKKPHSFFTCSMGDLFHEKLAESDILRMFDVMNKAHWHRFLALTKRAERLAELAPKINWAPNIWMGVTVEHRDYFNRIDCSRQVNTVLRFLSLEPLLGSLIGMDLTGIDWAIVGGESGPKARPMKKEWVEEIRDSCLEQSVPFFFKQWGGVNKNSTGRLLDGRTWEESPDDAKFCKSLQIPGGYEMRQLFELS